MNRGRQGEQPLRVVSSRTRFYESFPYATS